MPKNQTCESKGFTKFLPYIVLLLLAIPMYWHFGNPIIYSDDWTVLLKPFAFNEFHLINWMDRRPLVLTVFSLFSSIFGIRLEIYYVLLFLVNFLSAVFVFEILKRCFPGRTWLALPVTLVYMVFPVDYSRVWMAMLNIRVAWLLSLLALLLIVQYLHSTGIWKLVAGLVLFSLTLGVYEGHLGIISGAVVLLCLFSKTVPMKRRLAILSVLIIGLLFVIWRTMLQPVLFDVHDNYLATATLTPQSLLYALTAAVQVFMIGWARNLGDYLNLTTARTVLMFIVSTVICIGITWFITALANRKQPPIQKMDKRVEYRNLMYVIYAGIFLWLAGFIPVITVYLPNLDDVMSRFNMYAIAGAALILVSILAALTLWMAKSALKWRTFIFAAILPFLFAGSMTQYYVNVESRDAWNTQQQLWNGLFNIAPNFKDGTTLVVVIPDSSNLRPMQRLPISGVWEVDYGLQVLFNNPSIKGRFHYTAIEIPQPELTEAGVLDEDGNLIPYEKTVFVQFDPDSGRVRLIQGLEDELDMAFSAVGYDPSANIIPANSKSQKYRWLVNPPE